MNCNEKFFLVLLFFHLSSCIQTHVFAIVTDKEVDHDMESIWNSAGVLENHIKKDLADTNLATTGIQRFDEVVFQMRNYNGRKGDDWLTIRSYRENLKKNIIMYFKGVQFCKIRNDLFRGKMISLYKDIMEMDEWDKERKKLTSEKAFNAEPALYERQSASISVY